MPAIITLSENKNVKTDTVDFIFLYLTQTYVRQLSVCSLLEGVNTLKNVPKESSQKCLVVKLVELC